MPGTLNVLTAVFIVVDKFNDTELLVFDYFWLIKMAFSYGSI